MSLFLVFLFPLALASPLILPSRQVDAFTKCAYPNGSDTALYTYSCNQPGDTIEVTFIKVLDLAGNEVYPIDPTKPFILDLKAFNKGPSYTDNKVDVRIWELQTSWTTGQCVYNEIPTFGLLNNIDGCDFANNCPLTSGDLDLDIQLDLSQFASIISLLSSDTPIQLQIIMKDYNEGSAHEEICCVVAQMRID